MRQLQILILRKGEVVQVESFEDPRIDFIREFNELNDDNDYSAVLAEELLPQWRMDGSTCQAHRRCVSS